jgi:hypothetical protein
VNYWEWGIGNGAWVLVVTVYLLVAVRYVIAQTAYRIECFLEVFKNSVSQSMLLQPRLEGR